MESESKGKEEIGSVQLEHTLMRQTISLLAVAVATDATCLIVSLSTVGFSDTLWIGKGTLLPQVLEMASK